MITFVRLNELIPELMELVDLGRVPDFVREAEAAIAADEFVIPEPPQEVTIKFGKGLVGDPITTKIG